MNNVVIVALCLVSTMSMAGEPAALALKPRPLVKGDTVGLLAPASPIDEAQVTQTVEFLRQRGFAVKLAPGYRQPRGYLAAADEVRAAELNGFFGDPDVKAIFCLRGGYGTPRILDRVDYALVAKNPKILMGYSDVSALLNAVNARTGLVVFHGPMAKEMAAPGGLGPLASKHFLEAFQLASPLAEDWGTKGNGGDLKSLARGSAEGVLVGGNLSVLAAVLGTPYEPRFRDAILFLEDVNEKPFRIDRMLNQLRLAGKLAEVKGVLLGVFSGCEPTGGDDFGLEAVFADYFLPLGVPVLAGYPAGHISDQVTLPIGIRVRLDATARKLSLLEAAVSADLPSRAARK